MDTEHSYLTALTEAFIARFSIGELQLFALSLGIQQGDLTGATFTEQATALIQLVHRRQQWLDFLTRFKTERPNTFLQIPPWLLTEAERWELAGEYAKAIKIWHDIQQFAPEDAQVAQSRLEKKLNYPRHLIRLKQGLTWQAGEIKPVYRHVIGYLKHCEQSGVNAEAEINLELIEQFLAEQMAAADFIDLWQDMVLNIPPKQVSDLQYPLLVERLQQGDVVLFLGSELPQYLTPALAEFVHYPEFKGSFSAICEYMELNGFYGRWPLCRQVQALTDSAVCVLEPLYPLLAEVSTSLLLITTHYDTRLETAFRQHDKRFVVISHRYQAQAMGQLLMEYSDKPAVEQPSIESLSGLDLLAQGYSIIYKLSGCFHFAEQFKSSLLLSEQDYFMFARYVDKLIPDYIAGLLSGRGFWFLGHYPRNWEERLVMQAILQRRAHRSGMIALHQGACG